MTRRSLRADLDKLRRGLQLGLVGELGLRPLLEGGPRRLRARPAARLRAGVVHGRRTGRRDDRDGDHRDGRQPDAEADERQAPPARLVALPAPQPAPPTGSGSASSASSPSGSTPASPPSSTSNTSKPPPARSLKHGEAGFILETNHAMNSRPRSDERPRGEEVPRLRTRALSRALVPKSHFDRRRDVLCRSGHPERRIVRMGGSQPIRQDLAAARERASLSQEELADRADMHRTRSASPRPASGAATRHLLKLAEASESRRHPARRDRLRPAHR